MKSYLKVLAGTSFSLAMAGTSFVAHAADEVGNATQQGSLLVYPYIDVSPGHDTIIRIANDSDKYDVHVLCNWKNGTKYHNDFDFFLTKKQAVWFTASNGDGNIDASPFPKDLGPLYGTGSKGRFDTYDKGELKCWAVNDTNPPKQQVAFNYLFGSAQVINFVGDDAYEYNSFNFRTVDTTLADKAPVGTAGTILLDGIKEYQACPEYLKGNFSPRDVYTDGVYNGTTYLAIASCAQDFRQNAKETYTKLKFNIYNAREASKSGTWHCIDSWAYFPLEEVDNAASNFSYDTLDTTSGLFNVWGVKDDVVCRKHLPVDRTNPVKPIYSKTQKAGLVGVMVRNLGVYYNDNNNDEATATELNTHGVSALPNDKILWDY